MPMISKSNIEKSAGAFFGPGLLGAAIAAGKAPATFGPIPVSVVAAFATGLVGTMASSNILAGMSNGFTGMAGAQIGGMLGAPSVDGVGAGMHGGGIHGAHHDDLLGWMDQWDDDEFILGEEFDEEIEV